MTRSVIPSGWVVGLVALTSAALTTGCQQFAASGLQLRSDETIRIVEPRERDVVTTPFELRWTDDDRPAGSSYAVVINRAPPPPGEDLGWFARDDERCTRDPACPTERDLELRGVITADEPSVEVAIVPGVLGGRDTGEDEFTIIRVGPDGRRSTEAAFTIRLDVEDGNSL